MFEDIEYVDNQNSLLVNDELLRFVKEKFNYSILNDGYNIKNADKYIGTIDKKLSVDYLLEIDGVLMVVEQMGYTNIEKSQINFYYNKWKELQSKKTDDEKDEKLHTQAEEITEAYINRMQKKNDFNSVELSRQKEQIMEVVIILTQLYSYPVIHLRKKLSCMV